MTGWGQSPEAPGPGDQRQTPGDQGRCWEGVTGGPTSQWEPRAAQASPIPAARLGVGGVPGCCSGWRRRVLKTRRDRTPEQVRGPSPRGGAREGQAWSKGCVLGARSALGDLALGFSLGIVGLWPADSPAKRGRGSRSSFRAGAAACGQGISRAWAAAVPGPEALP